MGSMENSYDMNLDPSEFCRTYEFKPKRFPGKMLEEGVHADITIKANGGSVKAHRCVLASVSPVFYAMFQHNMREQLNSLVELPNMSIKGLKCFLVLLYLFPLYSALYFSDSINEHFEEIFEACCRFQVKHLEDLITVRLPDHLNANNCWEYLRKSEDMSRFCNIKDYKTSGVGPYSICQEYIVQLFKKVVEKKLQTDHEKVSVCFERLTEKEDKNENKM